LIVTPGFWANAGSGISMVEQERCVVARREQRSPNVSAERRPQPFPRGHRSKTSLLSRGGFGWCGGAWERHRSAGLTGVVGWLRVWAVTSPKSRCSGVSRSRGRQRRCWSVLPGPADQRDESRRASATRCRQTTSLSRRVSERIAPAGCGPGRACGRSSHARGCDGDGSGCSPRSAERGSTVGWRAVTAGAVRRRRIRSGHSRCRRRSGSGW
jgi:hypothetical protein